MRSLPRRTTVLLAFVVAGLAVVALADAARTSSSEVSGVPAHASSSSLARRLLQALRDGNENDNEDGGNDSHDSHGGHGSHDWHGGSGNGTSSGSGSGSHGGSGSCTSNGSGGGSNSHDNGSSAGHDSGSGSGHDNGNDQEDDGPDQEGNGDDDHDGVDNGDDDDAYEHDPTLGVAGIQDCKAALVALSLPYTGSTVFCPRASGMLWLAKYFGFASTAELLADIAPGGAGASRAAAEAYFELLVSPGRVLTQPDIPLGLTVLPTLLGNATGGEAGVRKTARLDHGATRYKVEFVYLGGDVDVQAFDLTFEGALTNGSSSPPYVVHALEHPVAPSGTYRASDDLFSKQRGALSSSAKLFKVSLREKKRGGAGRAGVSAAPSVGGVKTLLLPNNAAWLNVGAQPFASSKGLTVKSVQRNKAAKAKLLEYLTLPGDVRPGGAGTPFSAAGKPSVAADGTVTGGGGDKAKIVATYVAGRYVVHAIDGVVVPGDF